MHRDTGTKLDGRYSDWYIDGCFFSDCNVRLFRVNSVNKEVLLLSGGHKISTPLENSEFQLFSNMLLLGFFGEFSSERNQRRMILRI